VENVHLSVVVDLEALDGGDAKTAQVADEGIGDSNALDLSNAFGTEVQLPKTGKLDEAEPIKALERGELEVVKSLEVFKLELAVNGGDGGTGDRDDIATVLGNEVTLNLLGTVDNNSTGDLLVNDDISLDNLAVNAGRGLGNLDVAGAGGGWTKIVSYLLALEYSQIEHTGDRRDTDGRNSGKNLNGMHYDLKNQS
jgi:hypothetical protein